MFPKSFGAAMLNWRLSLGQGSMLCAPILHSLGSDGFIRANSTHSDILSLVVFLKR